MKNAMAMEPPKQKLHLTIMVGYPNEQPKIIVEPPPVPPLEPEPCASYSSLPVVQQYRAQRNAEIRSNYEQQQHHTCGRAAPYFPQVQQGQPERFTWTLDLHRRLVEAVASLGGLDLATPEKVFAIIKQGEESISYPDVFNHLFQLHRMLGTEKVPCFRAQPRSPGTSFHV
ncbi:hypothetical protein SLA2020_178180 [Shorea laevis]